MTILYRILSVLTLCRIAFGRRVQATLDTQREQVAQGDLEALSNVLLASSQLGRLGGSRLKGHSGRSVRLSMNEASQAPTLLRAARGEEVEHTPVWMMRQAGRHMQAYNDLVHKYEEKYPNLTFRNRSEDAALSKEITLQPYDRYGTDGVILFSDILTPLPAMGVEFDITAKMGIEIEPIRTREAFNRMTEHGAFNPREDLPFVATALKGLREVLDPKGATLLGFIGLPFTLATFLIEGSSGTKSDFAETRKLRSSDPELCHDMLSLLAHNIAQYAIHFIDSGAQVIQIFDSFAGHLTPEEFDEWAAPYEKMVVDIIKKERPDVPIIIFMAPDKYSKNGQLLTRLASSGADMVGIDHTIDLGEAKRILADGGYPDIGIQGNLDPDLLRDGPKEKIQAEAERILKSGGKRGYIMNLGSPIDKSTPEENVEFFVNFVQNFKHD